MILWRKGRGHWNTWVEDNPEAGIDFSDQVFEGLELMAQQPLISFNGFVFPRGTINFSRAKFGKGEVSFTNAKFTGGDVDFTDAKFESSRLYFIRADFGDGDINFNNAEFANEYVYFTASEFGHGWLDFSNANFGGSYVDFAGAKFESVWVKFAGTSFVDAEVNFNSAQFGNTDIDFSNANFGEGPTFFDNTNFGTRRVTFENTDFGAGLVNFRYCSFPGPTHFIDLQGMDRPRIFTFEGSAFDKLFTFSHQGVLGCPLDLRRTKMTHDVVVNDIRCNFDVLPMPKWASLASQIWSGMPERSAPIWRWTTKAKDREDSQRFRRLKELALSNRNHAKALEFHVQEIQSKRGHETRWWQDIAQFFFWLLGDYGRSVFRPIGWLIATWAGFAAYFFAYSTEQSAKFSAALAYSGSHMLSFIPTGRTARLQGQEWLFGEDTLVPEWALGVGAAESILSVILLFMLGLGLRNLFRV